MNLSPSSPNDLDVETLGQVFTPKVIVDFMSTLRQNKGLALEPSAGDGAFLKCLDKPYVAIEFDSKVAPKEAIVGDFFDFHSEQKFVTIIGNPPYVRFQDIHPSTRANLDLRIFDRRTNLYLFFIQRSMELLSDAGEIIFIVTRDFLKATASRKLNEHMHEQGAITHFVELGDNKVFQGATPNVAIFRFQKGSKSKDTLYLDLGGIGIDVLSEPAKLPWENRSFNVNSGQIIFSKSKKVNSFSDFFFVKVGAVSGADSIFATDKFGNRDFVSSETFSTGGLRRMLYNQYHPYLDEFKDKLISRRIKPFGENDWWMWGRGLYESTRPRIYVNQRTRHQQPFFTHSCTSFDGSVLAIFPKCLDADVTKVAEVLNSIDWHSLGFVIDGRFVFSQRSLENCPLDAAAARALESLLGAPETTPDLFSF